MEPLKRYLETRMESMKPKPVEKPPPEEFAAGIRKQFLVNHNCISCDRPVKYAREGTFPPLPTMHSMPGSKSNRPYTTFELEQIRQHMLQGGLAMSKERFELLEKQRNKLQKEILRLRLVCAYAGICVVLCCSCNPKSRITQRRFNLAAFGCTHRLTKFKVTCRRVTLEINFGFTIRDNVQTAFTAAFSVTCIALSFDMLNKQDGSKSTNHSPLACFFELVTYFHKSDTSMRPL